MALRPCARPRSVRARLVQGAPRASTALRLLFVLLLSARPATGVLASAEVIACEDRSLDFGGQVMALAGAEDETCPTIVPRVPDLFAQSDPSGQLLTTRQVCLTTLAVLSAALWSAGISWTPPAPFTPAFFVADVCSSMCAISGAYTSNCTQVPPSPPRSPTPPAPPATLLRADQPHAIVFVNGRGLLLLLLALVLLVLVRLHLHLRVQLLISLGSLLAHVLCVRGGGLDGGGEGPGGDRAAAIDA